jgi:serine protease inhibitor
MNIDFSSAPASNLFVEANNRFAFAMFQLLANKSEGRNQFYSPFSIESAVLMALEGARSETAQEIGDAIALPKQSQSESPTLPWNLAPVRSDLSKLLSIIQPQDDTKANSIRLELKRLREQLAKLNADSSSLTRKNQHAAAGKLSMQAHQVADQINSLATEVDQFQLKVANALWVEDSLTIKREFAENLERDHGTGQAIPADFKNAPEQQRTRINNWVAEQTNQMILDLIAKGDVDNQTAMVLVNAIYFLGTWSTPFERSQTKDTLFRSSANKTTNVSMMSNQNMEQGRYGAFHADGTSFETPTEKPENASPEFGYPEGGFQVAELPYNGNSLSMLIVVPNKDGGLPNLISLLTPEMLHAWSEAMAFRAFKIKLPKFKIECSTDLNAPLKALGMKLAFDDRHANFTGIAESRDDLFISKVVHKAVIDVNEQGTEAAAATAVIMSVRSAAPMRTLPFVPSVVADHPFLFLIRNTQTGAILFMGQFTNQE